MASPIPNERTLRKITIANLLPAFPLLIAAGVMSHKSADWWYNYHAEPTIIFFGLVPTFFSAITSTLFLKTTHDPLDKRPYWRAGLWFLLDAFLALANCAILVPVWILEPPNMNGHANYMMLETYATVLLMVNMFIHAYLALYHPFKVLSKGVSFGFWQTECPHCHGKLRAAEMTGGKRERYSLLRAEEYLDEPEASASTGLIRESTDSAV
ncbi:hypothetical protein BU23DRAFT_603030 [Bimuria novae-zelandiae CBS 107.79]|uniref:Uncharacterized protein n=1 Tax=Bimuria novae-zelandiae CBS 107.79 TaxID=1447943 RepID=A0A6A5UU06_9PLEO|nr:hypothetical protein BU23DRAFT_603030 [Bimuria novae-zelandiae CBS 107.79]